MPRLFTAIDIPDDIKGDITSLYTDIPGAKWVKEDNLHITLNFLGDVRDNQLSRLTNALSLVQFNPFKVRLSGAGFFKKGTLWIGIKKSEELSKLHNELKEIITLCGIEQDNRKYKPHLTVARLKYGSAEPFMIRAGAFKSREFLVDDFSLYSSVLEKTGAIHTKLC